MHPAALRAGAALVVIGSTLLVGCTAMETTAHPAHTAKAVVGSHQTAVPESTPATETPFADEFEYLPPAGTVMGSGTLRDVDGHATGDVTVGVAPDLRFQVAIDGFSTTSGPGLTVALSVDRFGSTTGEPTVPARDDPVGEIETTSGNPVLPFPSAGRRDRGDLSYFNSVG